MIIIIYMMTSTNENIFRVTGSLCGEYTGDLRRHGVHYDVTVMNNTYTNITHTHVLEDPAPGYW